MEPCGLCDILNDFYNSFLAIFFDDFFGKTHAFLTILTQQAFGSEYFRACHIAALCNIELLDR